MTAIRLISVFLFFLGFYASEKAHAQMVLQLEKTGSVKRVRYYVGDIIEFKTIHLPDVWQKRLITEIRPDKNLFMSDTDMFNVNTITHIREDSKWGPIISVGLYSIAVVSVLTSAGLYVQGFRPDNWAPSIIVPAAAAVLGWLVKRFWRYKIYHVGAKRRLRTLDLNFYQFEVEP